MKGIYVEGNSLHFDIPALLRELDLPDTKKNRDLAVEAATQAATEAGLITPSVKVEHTHLHRCVACHSDWKHDGKRTKCILPKYAQCPSCKN